MNIDRRWRVLSKAVRDTEALLIVLRGVDNLDAVGENVLKRIDVALSSLELLRRELEGGRHEG